MKLSTLSSCSALALLSLVACGGDAPAGYGGAGASGGNAPTPAPKTSPAPAPAESPVVGKAPEPAPAPAPQDQAQKPLPKVNVDHDMMKALFGRDPSLLEEVDNPGTPEKVALGKLLYHEKHLSKNGNLSCASCHDLANYGVDNKPKSPGTDGKDGDRNTPTTWNASRQFRQMWDGRAASVEEQALLPVLNPVEHGIADEAQLVAKIKEKPELVDGFVKAFGPGDTVTAANFKLAVGAFERTLVTKSKWDEYLDGNAKALGQDERFGLKAFIDVGCITCHGSRLVGGAVYQKTGALKPFGSKDEGRGKLTGSDADKFFFKVPGLLNVEKTAPYFHDGSAKTLEEAVTIMADIQLDKRLTPEQLRGIVAFLKALTGPLPAEYATKK